MEHYKQEEILSAKLRSGELKPGVYKFDGQYVTITVQYRNVIMGMLGDEVVFTWSDTPPVGETPIEVNK